MATPTRPVLAAVRVTSEGKEPWDASYQTALPVPLPDSLDERQALIEQIYLRAAQDYAARRAMQLGDVMAVTVSVDGSKACTLELTFEGYL